MPELPNWVEELKRRYLRGETSLFVLHGNVHDSILYDGELASVPDFLAQTVLAKKELVVRYNVSTGCRFNKRPARLEGIEELLVQRAPDKVLPLLERLLFTHDNVALLFE